MRGFMDLKELQDEFNALEADIDQMLAKTAPLRAEREEVNVQHYALKRRVTELTEQINAIEQPDLHAKKMRKAELARALQAVRVAMRKG